MPPMLRSNLGSDASSKRTFYNWFAKFFCTQVSVSDEFRKGRPKSVAQKKKKNNDAVRNMLKRIDI